MKEFFKEFFRLGAKSPFSFSGFVVTFTFLVFIILCVAAGFFTRENLGGVVTYGGKVHFLVFVALALAFKILSLWQSILMFWPTK